MGARDKPKEQEPPQPTEAEVLRRMLTTPPKPKKAKKKAESNKK
jgi:hypothetical protein